MLKSYTTFEPYKALYLTTGVDSIDLGRRQNHAHAFDGGSDKFGEEVKPICLLLESALGTKSWASEKGGKVSFELAGFPTSDPLDDQSTIEIVVY